MMEDRSAVFSAIAGKIKKARSVALFCHVRPDGDTLGGALAVKNCFPDKTADVYCDDDIPPKFSFLTGYGEIKRLIGAEYELYIAIDCSDIKRLGANGRFFFGKKETINIDHHITNERFASINLVGKEGSVCELLYKLFQSEKIAIQKPAAECIYCGLSSDTGNFSHSNTTKGTFLAAAHLTEIIGDISCINRHIFKSMSEGRLRLLVRVLGGLKSFSAGRIVVLTITKQDLLACGCQPYETEGLVDYAVNIETAEVGVTILEGDNNAYKVSFRSNGADVSKIAGEFGGGGHVRASGCVAVGEYSEVLRKIIKNTEFYLA
jgi:phosphoesterase RecJ-like protein